jgi:hypothetical protein
VAGTFCDLFFFFRRIGSPLNSLEMILPLNLPTKRISKTHDF